MIVLNDPYRGGTHLPDITMVSPVFIEGEPRFFVASRAHHADVGGMSSVRCR
ncbi:MAG: hydantoinase B/oxoprolinase family protein [Anaerolineae bacterium]